MGPCIRVDAVRKSYGRGGLLGGGRTVVLDDVSFEVGTGEVVALVGESGSGKSTIARVIARLEDFDAGALVIGGAAIGPGEARRVPRAFRRDVQLVFQDPFASLSPLHSVAEHVERPLALLTALPEAERSTRALAVLRDVGLTPPEAFASRMPYELSGGQRQRVAIARAIASSPALLVADEPTSMLDVSLRAGVLALFDSLRRERQLAVLLITHDLAAAAHLADRILVLYRGAIVEEGPAARVLAAPAHPYTQALVEAVTARTLGAPRPPVDRGREAASGCAYAARCASRVAACTDTRPAARTFEPERRVRCHLFPLEPETPRSAT